MSIIGVENFGGGSDVVPFALIILLAFIFFLDHQKKMMMIAKGLPPDKPRHPEGQDHVLAGMIFCFVGLAFLVTMLVLRDLWFVFPGTVLVAIGLALLIEAQMHLARHKKESQQ